MTPMFLVRRAAMGAALGFAVGLSYFLPAVPVLIDVDAPIAESARTMIGNEMLSVMLISVLLSLSARWAHGPAARVAATVLVIAIVIAARALIVTTAASAGWFEMEGGESARGAAIFGLWHVIAAGVLLAVYFDQLRRVQASAGRLRAAQIERQRVERDMLESRLNVIRARVDPVFLFESLAEVRRVYGRDAGEAETLLDDLIHLLRSRVDRAGRGVALEFPETRKEAA